MILDGGYKFQEERVGRVCFFGREKEELDE